MKKWWGAALLFYCLCCTGCFDLIEQVTLQPNGQGSLQLVLNLSKSKTRVQQILQMKTINGRPVPTRAEINEKAAALHRTLAAIPGISQVQHHIDYTNCIATLQLQFNQVQQLNTALRKVQEQEGNAQPITAPAYQFTPATGRFSRLQPFTLQRQYQELSAADREVFTNARYTAVYRFAREVDQTTHKQARIAANKKAVLLQLNALDIITGKQTIEQTILLKH